LYDDDQIDSDEDVDVGKHESGSEGRRSPFGFLRCLFSNNDKPISTGDAYSDYIYNVSYRGSRDSNSSKEMDELYDTKSVGGYNDNQQFDDDETLPDHEEEYEDWLATLGRTMASKFVSGIHRYLYFSFFNILYY